MKSKGFTLIELVIVMVILAILVTLGVPKFLGQSEKAQKTKLISDGRVLEDSINRYYIDHGDWPRLTPEDRPLTDAELTSKIYALNDKGFEAPFPPEEGAKYYDINLEALKPYIKSFNSDIKHFVLQNPVGSVYIQDPKENARLSGSAETPDKENPELGKPVAVISIQPEGDIFAGDSITYSHEESTSNLGKIITTAEWEGNEPIFSDPGNYTIRLRVKDSGGFWSEWAETTITVLPKKQLKMLIAAGDFHSLALTEGGKVYSFGSGQYGQLGLGVGNNKYTPTIISAMNSINIVEIVSGADHSLILSDDGRVYAFGRNNYGKLGIGSTTDKGIPTEITGLSGIKIKQISAGESHSAVLAEDGRVFSFGLGSYGQIGDNSTTSRYSPTEVKLLADKEIIQISCGSNHTLALSKSGEVYSFGYNGFGQLGTGDKVNKRAPTLITTLSGKSVKMIEAGGMHSIALTADGKVFVFGNDSMGQLGLGKVGDKLVPTELGALSSMGVVSIEAGYNSSFVITGDKKIYAFGKSDYYKLGTGSVIDQAVPVESALMKKLNPVQIKSSQYHTMILSENGEVYAVGFGGSGQLGYGNTGDKTSPTKIPSFSLKSQ